MLCGSLNVRGVGDRMDTCTCVTECPCCPSETVTTLLICDPLIYNQKFKKVKKLSAAGIWVPLAVIFLKRQ